MIRRLKPSAAMAGIGEDRGSPRHPCLAHQRRTAMVARDDVLARHRLAGWSQSVLRRRHANRQGRRRYGRRAPPATDGRSDDARAGVRGAPAARDQFGMPIMQSLKRCACIWPMWLRPSPSYCSLPTIWRHFCSSD
jgi:hypothetical protein